MNKVVDITGRVFGHLTIIRLVGKNKHNHSVWECQCSCGNIVCMPKGNLTSGNTKSCGCSYPKLPEGAVSANEIFSQYKRNASKRKLEFLISKELFLFMTSLNCYYCGVPPSNHHKSRGTGGAFVYNGIDRIDSSVGYIEGNVVPCCRTCNVAKNALSYTEFKKWVFQVSENFRVKELFGENEEIKNLLDYERINQNAVS